MNVMGQILMAVRIPNIRPSVSAIVTPNVWDEVSDRVDAAVYADLNNECVSLFFLIKSLEEKV